MGVRENMLMVRGAGSGARKNRKMGTETSACADPGSAGGIRRGAFTCATVCSRVQVSGPAKARSTNVIAYFRSATPVGFSAEIAERLVTHCLVVARSYITQPDLCIEEALLGFLGHCGKIQARPDWAVGEELSPRVLIGNRPIDLFQESGRLLELGEQSSSVQTSGRKLDGEICRRLPDDIDCESRIVDRASAPSDDINSFLLAPVQDLFDPCIPVSVGTNAALLPERSGKMATWIEGQRLNSPFIRFALLCSSQKRTREPGMPGDTRSAGAADGSDGAHCHGKTTRPSPVRFRQAQWLNRSTDPGGEKLEELRGSIFAGIGQDRRNGMSVTEG
jgi:hypothetical protein